ncbi:MAG TPA: hypothetical protein P5293_04900 [Bacteroidales bacterium]|nr:hypothetical protein [Bacteroidales bacterium]
MRSHGKRFIGKTEFVFDPTGDEVLEIVTINNINIDLANRTPASTRLTAFDLIVSVHGGIGEITYHMSKNGMSWSSSTNPQLAYLDYTSADIGSTAAYVKVTDESAQEDYVIVSITLQDNYGRGM